MNIIVSAPNGIRTINMFLNTNIDFVDLILWNTNVKCSNCDGLNRIKVNDNKQTNGSTKMMKSKMIQLRKKISYQNSFRQNIYNIIYSHNFYSNVDLINKCNYKSYMLIIQTILRTNSISQDRKLKIMELMSRIKVEII